MLRFIPIASLTPFVTFVTFVAIAAPSPVFAHQEEDAPATDIEVGTLFGFSYSPAREVTVIGGPSVPIFSWAPGIPALYVSWFPREWLALGPEFSLGMTSSGKDSLTDLYLGIRGAFFVPSNAVSSPYLLVNGILQELVSDGDFNTYFAAGAGLGYQKRVGSAFVLRVEGRFRRWFHNEEFPIIKNGATGLSFLIGLGTRFGGQ